MSGQEATDNRPNDGTLQCLQLLACEWWGDNVACHASSPMLESCEAAPVTLAIECLQHVTKCHQHKDVISARRQPTYIILSLHYNVHTHGITGTSEESEPAHVPVRAYVNPGDC